MFTESVMVFLKYIQECSVGSCLNASSYRIYLAALHQLYCADENRMIINGEWRQMWKKAVVSCQNVPLTYEKHHEIFWGDIKTIYFSTEGLLFLNLVDKALSSVKAI